MRKLGIYVHIPFCKSKCYYCDFVSYPCQDELIKPYCDALIKEIKNYKLEKYEIPTIYIGGGTPSFLESSLLCEILSKIPHDSKTEITVEINPGTATVQKLEQYKNAGVNRLSIGLQATQNETLKSLGRIHTYEQFVETYNTAREIGFNNINIDILLGLPSQTLEELTATINKVIELNPEHISVYSLILEEGTKLCSLVENGLLHLPAEEEERKMYWCVKKQLENAGYIHYEISNFAKLGYEARHNLDCWNQKEYIGLGAAAHSYIDKTRYSNTEDIREYIENMRDVNTNKNRIIHEGQDEQACMKEYVLLGLRKIRGVCKTEFLDKFGASIDEIFSKKITKLKQQGLIEENETYIILTNKGIDLANIVWQEFI